MGNNKFGYELGGVQGAAQYLFDGDGGFQPGGFGLPNQFKKAIPRDGLIHEWLFNNNVLDTGSVGNDLTVVNGDIEDIMTTDRKGNSNCAMRSNNTSIILTTASNINLQKGWSFNWWQLMDDGSSTANLFYYGVIARFIRFLANISEWDIRPDAGTTVKVNCPDFERNLWQNLHVNYGNGTIEVFINNISQGTASNVDHTTPLTIQRVCSAQNTTSIDVSFDNVRMYNRLLDSAERASLVIE